MKRCHRPQARGGKAEQFSQYGNLLFFWDVLFGTAKITRTYPQSYGVENLAPATLGQQLLWPIFPQNREVSNHIRQDQAAPKPA